MFNVFNHPNFIGLNNNLSFDATPKFKGDPCNGKAVIPGSGGEISHCGVSNNIGSFGRLSNDLGPRVIQFGLKFTF